ncbi:Putative Chitosanase [[Torrubiella] hemipterigena]|uniref:Endo-chitosanase n=1 Tax=[Torrubiella] hemipterigena TaxID=1531966 RepID=A0A0A1TJN3_9HYPO|nr:Putative Chitosanase [[Torrubiella] hemipterigena]
MYAKLAAIAALGATASAYDIPDNLRQIYNNHKSGGCSSSLAGPFAGGASYCADIPNAIFLKGNGQYDNMDTDCDGLDNTAGDCGDDQTGQSQTAFQGLAQSYGIEDLNANIHTYVVFGNEGGNPSFNPQNHGIKPLSVMAVVCNNQVYYGVWGDTNGGTTTGEAAISLGQICFPNEGIRGNNGHGPNDVLYIAFTGDEAVPGKNGANWKAGDKWTFEESIRGLGERLVSQLPGGGGGSQPPPTGGNCSWAGHCEGATCGSDNDCSDDLTCSGGRCSKGGNSSPPPPPPCSWQGHCLGDRCSNENDCADNFVCKSGKCANP